MKKMVLLATALAMVSGSALAADLHVKAMPPPPPPFEPWDFAFGSAIMNDYIFRGITQSNHKPSVAAYFEPRYNVTKDFQFYVGMSGESISFPNRAAGELDFYGGFRPTFGMFAFDFGAWGYIYPGGQCFGSLGATLQGNCAIFGGNTDFGTPPGGLPINGNFAKKSASFYEVYGKVNVTVNDQWQFGVNEYYSPNFLNLGAWGNYASITGKWTSPSTIWGPAASACISPASSVVSGWERLTRSMEPPPLPPLADPSPPAFRSPATTLGMSASALPTRCSPSICATPTPTSRRAIVTPSPAITAPPISARPTLPRSIPGGFGSNWCGATGIAKLSADLTAMTNLK